MLLDVGRNQRNCCWPSHVCFLLRFGECWACVACAAQERGERGRGVQQAASPVKARFKSVTGDGSISITERESSKIKPTFLQVCLLHATHRLPTHKMLSLTRTAASSFCGHINVHTLDTAHGDPRVSSVCTYGFRMRVMYRKCTRIMVCDALSWGRQACMRALTGKFEFASLLVSDVLKTAS